MDKGGQGQTHKTTKTGQHLYQVSLKSFQPFLRYYSGRMDRQTDGRTHERVFEGLLL